MSKLNIEAVRAQFPALNQPVNGDVLPIFFDNPGGTQVPYQVIDAVTHYYKHMNANSGGAFATSRDNDAMAFEARVRMADFLHAYRPEEIVFGANMTTLNFNLSRAIAKTLKPGDEIVLTRMDHDANIAPWLRIAEDHNLVLRWADILEEDCTLDMNSLEAALTDKTRLVATVHASNAAGTINPVKQIADMAHAAGALYIVDAVQSAPHVPIDVQEIGCDFLLCSAYKFFGPHIGILWGRYDLLAALPAYKVRPAKDKPPYRWETGTSSFETIAGVSAVIDYLNNIGREHNQTYVAQFPSLGGRQLELKAAMAVLSEYERELVKHLIEMLQAVPGVRIYGITNPNHYHERVPTVMFTMEGRTPSQIAHYLAQQHTYVWDGNYYAVEIMKRLGHEEEGMVRVGLAHYNTHAEIERLGFSLRNIS